MKTIRLKRINLTARLSIAGILIAMLFGADARSQDVSASRAGQASAKASEADQAAWRELIEIAGASITEETDLEKIFGPLPGESALHDDGSLPPREFLALYRSAGDRNQRIMRLFLAARLRNLSRQGLLTREAATLLAPEPPGVSGSEFFGIPPIPGEAYSALINYIQSAAEMIPKAEYQPSQSSRDRIGRHLQASLALSSARARSQYADFDVVWSGVLIETVCAGSGSEKAMAPGLLWLYAELRKPAGLEFLPEMPEDMKSDIEGEAGSLFQKARAHARNLPPNLAALTSLPCRR